MAHQLKLTEWQSGSDRWYCADVTNAKKGSADWWHGARVLNISPVEFVQLLVDKFHVNHMDYNRAKNVLLYSWDKKEDCHKFVLYINRLAKERNYCNY